MAYSPDVTRLPAYRVKDMDAQLPSYDTPITLHEMIGDMSLNPEQLMIKAEEEEAEELERYSW